MYTVPTTPSPTQRIMATMRQHPGFYIFTVLIGFYSLLFWTIIWSFSSFAPLLNTISALLTALFWCMLWHKFWAKSQIFRVGLIMLTVIAIVKFTPEPCDSPECSCLGITLNDYRTSGPGNPPEHMCIGPLTQIYDPCAPPNCCFK